MKRFAFIARHKMTDEQRELAAELHIELDPVGDRDAFSVDPAEFRDYDGVVVVHPAAALRLGREMPVAVFQNGERASENGRPCFRACALHIFDRW